MKRLSVAILVLTLLLIVPASIAGSFQSLRVDHIRMPYGPVARSFPIRVEVANEQSNTAEDVHVRTWIPTFSDRAYAGIEEVNGFNRGENLFQDTGKNVKPGEYWVRITVSNDDERRVKHRLVWVK